MLRLGSTDATHQIHEKPQELVIRTGDPHLLRLGSLEAKKQHQLEYTQETNAQKTRICSDSAHCIRQSSIEMEE